MDVERLNEYDQWLAGKPNGLPAAGKAHQVMVQKGILVTLAQDGSPEAVQSICRAVTAAPNPDIAALALTILDHLALAGSQDARDAFALLAINNDHSEARRLVVERQYTHHAAAATAVLYLLTGQQDAYNRLDPNQQLLTTAYQSAEPALQKKIVRVARQTGLDDWATTVTAVQAATPEALAQLTEIIPHFKSEQARDFAVQSLRGLADLGSPDAREAICRLFIETGDPLARHIAVKEGYAPEDSVQRAIFYLLSGQQEKYETLDFNRSLLTIGYETAGKSLRQRLIAQTRRLGHLEWAQALIGGRRVRWVSDMTDADWEIAVAVLKQGEKWPELWQLAQIAPPVWSARVLLALRDSGWVERQDEREAMRGLIEQAEGVSASPPGAPLKATLTGHLHEITCLAASPNGKLVASGAMDQTICVWDSQEGRLRRRLVLPRGQVRSLAFSPDGEIIACGNGDGSIQLYRLMDEEMVKIFLGHNAMVKGLAIGPEGWIIASASFDQSVKLWRFPYGPELKTLNGHSSEVFAVEIAPNGRLLASGSADKSVRLWSLPDGVPLKTLDAHTDTVTSLAISPDGLMMASGGRDNVVCLWNLPDGYLRHRLDPQKSLVTSLAIHPDGQVLASAGFDGSVTLWSISNGRPLLNFSAHERAATGLVITDGGNTLATSSVDRSVRLFDLRMLLLTRLPLEQVRAKHDDLTRLAAAKTTSEGDRRWLAFTAALLQWRGRFDIALGEPRRIEVGEFDIEIVP